MALNVSHLDRLKVPDLRPTQVTVGLREVEEKREEWLRLSKEDRKQYLKAHVVPIVKGPEAYHYVVDHHHVARALLEDGHKHVWATAVKDLSHLAADEFWAVMDHQSLVHPFDAQGHRVPYSDIPRSLAGLVDDPFRSLAGEVRRRGGFAKITEPYSEFVWADFFRRRMSSKALSKDFEAAVAEALTIAHSNAAVHLPGWCAVPGTLNPD